MTETIDFKLTLDANGANRALDETRKRAENLGGGLESLQKGMGQLKERLEKQAAAIAVVSHAFGQHDSAVGKAVSSIGTLAAAYGAGGPFGLALAAAIPIVEGLNQAFKDMEQGSIAYSQSVSAIGPNITRMTNDALKPARDTLASINAEFRNLGVTVAEARLRVVSDAYQSTSASIEALERNRSKFMQRTDLPADIKDAIAKQTLRRLEEMRANQGELLAGYETASAQAASIAAANDKPTTSGGDSTDYASLRSRRLNAAQGRLDAAAGRHQGRLDSADLEQFDRVQKARAEIAEETNRRMLEDQKAYHEENMRMAEQEMQARQKQAGEYAGIAATMAAALGSAAATAAFSQEEAFKLFVSAASQAAGGFITLEGGKLIASGIAALASPIPNPMGFASIAGGLGLVAAGAAVTTGGPMAVQQLMGQAGAGSSGGGGSNIEAARTSGVGGSRGGGRGSNYGGGGTNITIVYGGASGPTADDGARAVVGALRRAERRGFIQPRVL